MQAMVHYSFVDKGGCNGLAMDAKNQILFAAYGRSGNPPTTQAQPIMVILSAKRGQDFHEPAAGGWSAGAWFNPDGMEPVSTQGNDTMTFVKETSPTTFEQTMNGARTIGWRRRYRYGPRRNME